MSPYIAAAIGLFLGIILMIIKSFLIVFISKDEPVYDGREKELNGIIGAIVCLLFCTFVLFFFPFLMVLGENRSPFPAANTFENIIHSIPFGIGGAFCFSFLMSYIDLLVKYIKKPKTQKTTS